MTACVDRDYDLSDLDFDNVAIGDENSEFRIPLATVQVSMDEIAENGVNIEAIFREADIWLPSSEKEVNLPALTGDSDYRDGLIGNTIAEMRQDPEKAGRSGPADLREILRRVRRSDRRRRVRHPARRVHRGFQDGARGSPPTKSKPGSSRSPRTTSKPSTSNRWSTKSGISTSTTR